MPYSGEYSDAQVQDVSIWSELWQAVGQRAVALGIPLSDVYTSLPVAGDMVNATGTAVGGTVVNGKRVFPAGRLQLFLSVHYGNYNPRGVIEAVVPTSDMSGGGVPNWDANQLMTAAGITYAGPIGFTPGIQWRRRTRRQIASGNSSFDTEGNPTTVGMYAYLGNYRYFVKKISDSPHEWVNVTDPVERQTALPDLLDSHLPRPNYAYPGLAVVGDRLMSHIPTEIRAVLRCLDYRITHSYVPDDLGVGTAVTPITTHSFRIASPGGSSGAFVAANTIEEIEAIFGSGGTSEIFIGNETGGVGAPNAGEEHRTNLLSERSVTRKWFDFGGGTYGLVTTTRVVQVFMANKYVPAAGEPGVYRGVASKVQLWLMGYPFIADTFPVSQPADYYPFVPVPYRRYAMIEEKTFAADAETLAPVPFDTVFGSTEILPWPSQPATPADPPGPPALGDPPGSATNTNRRGQMLCVSFYPAQPESSRAFVGLAVSFDYSGSGGFMFNSVAD
jgi:hypothetical protein